MKVVNVIDSNRLNALPKSYSKSFNYVFKNEMTQNQIRISPPCPVTLQRFNVIETSHTATRGPMMEMQIFIFVSTS